MNRGDLGDTLVADVDQIFQSMQQDLAAATGPDGAQDTTMADSQGAAGINELGPGPANVAAPAAPSAVYVGLTEVKEQVSKATRKGGTGNSYQIKFYLADATGTLHHCVTGVDTGDSHYEYTAESGFPALFCHNKAEVKVWAERIMAASQARAGFTTDIVKDEIPADGSSPQLPTFVSYREEKEDTEDGRHVIKWFLIDSQGHGHLAVTGEEKDTKDGHYHYHTETVFNLAAPLEAGNQDSVHRWLDSMVIHPGMAPRAAGGKAPARGGARTPEGGHSPHTRQTPFSQPHAATAARAGGRATGGSRGRGPGRPPAGVATGGGRGTGGRGRARGRGRGDTLLRQATANMARKVKGATSHRHDPEKEARDFVAAELKKWATDETQAREHAKNAALNYVTAGLEERESTMLAQCMPILTQAATQPNFLPASSLGTATFEQQSNLLATLCSLRELAHAYVPLALVAQPGVKEALAALKVHPHPDVSTLASSIIDQWLRVAVTNTLVLANPTYARDPRHDLEDMLHDPATFDAIVTAVTHRSLQSQLPQIVPETPGEDMHSYGEQQQGQPGYEATVERRRLEGELVDFMAAPSLIVEGEAEMLGGLPPPALPQQQQPQSAVSMDLENAASMALVDAPVPPDADDGAQILGPYEQQLAAEGMQF